MKMQICALMGWHAESNWAKPSQHMYVEKALKGLDIYHSWLIVGV